MKNKKLQLRLFSKTSILFVVLGLSLTAHASFNVLETAEILPAGQNRIGFAPQLYLGNGGGLDTSAYLDIPVDRDMNARFELASGTTDFWASGALKWVPYPDYEKQPAIGVKAQFMVMRDNNSNFYNTQITPLVSKKYQSKIGQIIPYAGLPMTLVYNTSTNNFIMTKLCIGSEWTNRPDFQTGIELGIDLYNGSTSDTYTASTLSVYFNFQFDEKIGFKK
ncbi:MAG: hypothetical protein ACXVAX_09560 [Pseudobdellovibrio sp.]